MHSLQTLGERPQSRRDRKYCGQRRRTALQSGRPRLQPKGPQRALCRRCDANFGPPCFPRKVRSGQGLACDVARDISDLVANQVD
jgi:hypothetical protein